MTSKHTRMNSKLQATQPERAHIKCLTLVIVEGVSSWPILGIPGSPLICSAAVLTFDVLKTKAKAMQMRVAKLEGESGEGDADNTEDGDNADNADNAEEENDEDESGEDEKRSDLEKGSANGDAGATQKMPMDEMPMDDDP